MRGTFSFFGVFLSVLSGTKGMVNETYDTTIACGNKTAQCPLYCQVCIGHPLSDCYEMMHDYICYNTFTNSMDQFNNTDFCLWHVVQRPYNAFSECSEEIADCLLIPWPNPHVEKIFVDIHAKYFQDCTVEELRDPPPSVVFALVMTPICLIPAMVFLVVLKTKNGDGRS